MQDLCGEIFHSGGISWFLGAEDNATLVHLQRTSCACQHPMKKEKGLPLSDSVQNEPFKYSLDTGISFGESLSLMATNPPCFSKSLLGQKELGPDTFQEE